jgi:hypothetical protein
MKYALLMCAEHPGYESEAPPGELDASAWAAEMTQRKIRSFGDRLAEPHEAKTVRIRDKRVFVTDGPFAETKEMICGFDVVECDSIDAAIEVASAHPMARFGMIEVRPFWTAPG